MSHKVCIIRGDGIGPEISDAVEKIIAAAGVDIDWVPLDAGLKCVEAGEPIVPDRTIDTIREVGIALKAPMSRCHPRETFEIRAVARMRYHKRAVERRIGSVFAP